MTIHTDTKYNLGDRVWTSGWDITSKDVYNKIPVQCEVFDAFVRATPFMGETELNISYGLMPINCERYTITFPTAKGFVTTDFPTTINEAEIFVTREECAKDLEDSLPF